MYKQLCEMRDLINAARWKFAKTMPKTPHWYTLRKNWERSSDFDRLVIFIREHGYPKYYGRTKYIYFNINGVKYWTMGAPVAETILINRAKVEDEAQYDELAPHYDKMFSTPQFKSEDRELIALLPELTGRVLDVGCGTGLLLDYCNVDDYTGVDPSSGMLAMLKAKHPNANVVQTPFESFCDGGFDVIVSLFASASYIPPQYLSRIPLMLNPLGKHFIMFFKPGYSPEAHKQAGKEFTYFENSHERLGGEQVEFGNYIIVIGGA